MEHLEKLTEILGNFYNWDKRRLPFLGNLISSIIKSRSVNMQKVAENIEGEAETMSNYRRIQRLFKDQDFDYNNTARMLAGILPNNEKWTLTLDRTNWKIGKKNVNILVLAVAYKGMAIPLFWEFLKKNKEEDDKNINEGKRGNSNTTERINIMKKFIEVFGKEKIEVLTADREFIGKEWFKYLIDEDIPLVIRIKKNTKLENIFFDVENIDALFKNIKYDEFYGYGKADIFNTELHIGGIQSKKSKEPLILVSNRKMKKETLKIYKKRWEIETLFSALKSRGFNFEETKITDSYKIEKLMALLSICFVWTIRCGEYMNKKKNYF